MKIISRNVCVCILVASCFWAGAFLADRQKLQEQLIRFHVVAASDTEEDQQAKVRVKEAVLESIAADLAAFTDADQAAGYLQEKMPYIRQVAADTLEKLGCGESVAVTLGKEPFGRKSSEGVSIPAGIYQTLRITIGAGEGQNWWGVVFSEAAGKTQTVFSADEEPNSQVERSEPQLRLLIGDILERLGNILFSG